jgi:hypothetical protein
MTKGSAEFFVMLSLSKHERVLRVVLRQAQDDKGEPFFVMLSLSKHERVSRVVLRQAQDDKGGLAAGAVFGGYADED